MDEPAHRTTEPAHDTLPTRCRTLRVQVDTDKAAYNECAQPASPRPRAPAAAALPTPRAHRAGRDTLDGADAGRSARRHTTGDTSNAHLADQPATEPAVHPRVPRPAAPSEATSRCAGSCPPSR